MLWMGKGIPPAFQPVGKIGSPAGSSPKRPFGEFFGLLSREADVVELTIFEIEQLPAAAPSAIEPQAMDRRAEQAVEPLQEWPLSRTLCRWHRK
jgi:hypothetical protein